MNLFSVIKKAYKKLFRYRLVKTFVWETTIREHPNRSGKVYIHCFESARGGRMIETATTHSSVTNSMFVVKQWSVFHEIVVPWLNHRHDPSIPTYKDVELKIEQPVADQE